MKEIRVYAICSESPEVCNLSNAEFMQRAEDAGNVYSLKGFEADFNGNYFYRDNTYIRFIEVECAESINFEEWAIPVVKLNE